MIKFFNPTIEKINVVKGNVSKNIKFSVKTKEMKQNNDLIIIEYYFLVDYGEAKIELEGNIFGRGNEKEIKSFVEYWKEKGEIDKKLFILFYNMLMANLFNKIVILCELVNLPVPINLPLIREENYEEKEESKENVKDLSNVKEEKEEESKENQLKIEDIED